MTDKAVHRSLGDAPQMRRSTPEIVVGVDDELASGYVLRRAAHHSQLTGLPLRVVHVWQMSSLVAAAATSCTHHYWTAAAGDARARVTRRVAHTLDSSTDVPWTLEIIEGEPGPALVARSDGAHLLVLGTGGQTRLRPPVLHYCLSHAVPPILAVPTNAGRPPTHGRTRSSATARGGREQDLGLFRR